MQLARVGQIGIALLELGLNGRCARQGVDDGLEHGEHRVACVVHHLALLVLDGAGNQIQILAQTPMRRVLVRACQPAVIGYVGVENGRELARQAILIHETKSSPGMSYAKG